LIALGCHAILKDIVTKQEIPKRYEMANPNRRRIAETLQTLPR